MSKKKIIAGVLAGTVIATGMAFAGVLYAGSGSISEIVKPSQVLKTQQMSTVVKNQEAKSGVTLHYKWSSAQPHLYYQADGVQKMSAPGVPMKDEGNGWYTYTIEDVDSAELILSVPELDFTTSEFTRDKGEYWYDDATGWSTTAPLTYKEVEVDQVAVSKDNASKSADGNVTVHYPMSQMKNAKVYYWNVMPIDMETAWPGQEMAYDDTWYTYTFNGVDKVNFLFTNGDDQTEDFTIKKAGEYWYADGKWTEKEGTSTTPTATQKPGSSSKPTSTAAPSERSDFRDETIYFAMTTRFYDGDKSNNKYCWDDEYYLRSETNNDPGWRGDFKGLAEKLDYIKALGFSAVWITPVVENASGLDYHGYHAYDFSKVDPRYESNDYTYQDLINDAHAKGIKIIQDIVINHTGNWGEKNLLPMFEKEADDGSTKSPFMVAATSGTGADKLSQGVAKYGLGASSYADIQNLGKDKGTIAGAEYQSRLAAMKEDSIDTDRLYHHEKSLQWETYTVQTGQIAGDCVDLNTENHKVAEYLNDSYSKYINMGVDAFRIDTTMHVSRLSFNEEYIPAFRKAGGNNFYMFGEVCVRRHEIYNSNIPSLSVCFYTWAEDKDYGWSKTDALTNEKLVAQHYEDNCKTEQPKSDNAFLKNVNEYHEPDTSKASGLNTIDFKMHWAFRNANDAFSAGCGEDFAFNDSTWNVVYVDSHDYAPDQAPENQRFAGSQQTWAENMNLMFTFRGIPCIYYGSEIEFMKGACIDPMTTSNGGEGSGTPYVKSGRAYFGDKIEGSVDCTDYGVYSNATGTMAETLNYPLAKHVQRLNLIRRAVPALRKGQYSTEKCSGGMSFRRRYTSGTDDSYVLVNLSGQATFSDVINGEYVELITGKTVTVTDGTLKTESVGAGNMRVYVLQNDTARRDGATGKIGTDGTYLK